MEKLAAVKKIKNNTFVLDLLVTQLKTSLGVLPFVGAGLSIPFGFKGWQQFLLTIDSTVSRQKIAKRIKQGQFEEAAQDLLDALGPFDFQDVLTMEYGTQKLTDVSVKGAVSYLPRLASGPVITTNFDRVLEKVFDDSGARFEERIWGPKVQTAIKAVIQNKRYLLKLHGDVDDDADRVLTLNEYAKRYGVKNKPDQIDFKKPLPHLLQILLTNRPVLFLGCSLHNDRIVKLIKQLGGPAANLPHYAIVEHPGDKDFHQKNKIFASYGIRRIWYPKGEHEYVEHILEYLCTAISPQPFDTKMSPKRKTLVVGMKAPQALEALIRKHPEIDTFTVIKYRDKLRLPERTTARPSQDPATFIDQAAVHNNVADQEEHVSSSALGIKLWERLFQLPPNFVLAASSRVQLKNGKVAHLPMIDFKCDPTDENMELAKEAFVKIGQTDGVLLNSGNSFHYYGERLMTETEWVDFLGHCLLLSDFIDTRYVGHALINKECRLRLSATPLNPFIPTVVKVF
ncbi:MAG TPA: SIR2 family protein [Pyrinomonadaceae bacterium]|nr:SIR2 family protein [Pyrinomonadaceae bacterium]